MAPYKEHQAGEQNRPTYIRVLQVQKQHSGRSILKYNPSTTLDGSIAIIDGVTAMNVPSTQFVQETSGVPPPPPPSVTVAPANVRAVSSAAELLQAVQDGVLDIEVTAHLDLRELSVARNPYLMPNGPRERFFTHTMYVDSMTRSIRVRILNCGACSTCTESSPAREPASILFRKNFLLVNCIAWCERIPATRLRLLPVVLDHSLC